MPARLVPDAVSVVIVTKSLCGKRKAAMYLLCIELAMLTAAEREKGKGKGVG